jgi:hypothetical protein
MKGFSKNNKLVLGLVALLCLLSLQSNSQRRWTNDFGNTYRQKLNVSFNYPLVNSIKPQYSVYLGFESVLLITITKQMTGAIFPRFGYTVGSLDGDSTSIDFKAYSVGIGMNKYFRLRNTHSSIMWNFGLGYELKVIDDAKLGFVAGKTGYPKENKSPTMFMQTGIYYVIPLGRSRNVQFVPGLEINTDFNNYTFPLNQYVPGYERVQTQIDIVAGLSFNLN